MHSKQLKSGLRFLFVVMMLGSFSVLYVRAADDTTTQRKDMLQQMYERSISFGDVDAMSANYAADYVNHGFGADIDLTEFKAFLSAWPSAMPDFKATPEVIIAEDDYAASRVIFSGTFNDKWVWNDETIEPNNKPIQVAFNIIHHFNTDGKISEDFTAFDRLGMLIQMDAAPKLPPYISSTLVTGKYEPIVMGETLSSNMEEAHKTGYASVINDALNKGDLSAIDKYMAEDYLTYEPFGNFTRDMFRNVVVGFRTVVPDLHVDTNIILAEGDWLAGRLVYTGTFGYAISQDDVSIQPTGKPIQFVINVFVRFNKDGIGIADYKEYNRLAWMQQLGLLPAPQN